VMAELPGLSGLVSGADGRLDRVGKAIRSAVRKSDMVARYEDDRLIIAMPQVDPAALEVITEKIRAKVVESEGELGDRMVLSSTASLMGSQPVETMMSLIEGAGESLTRNA
jgi:PleD family two-component response regulator